MTVYIVVNKTCTKDGVDKLNIVGVYDDKEYAEEQYKKFLNNGRYKIVPMMVNQTVMNTGNLYAI